jgi:hypothetical protein
VESNNAEPILLKPELLSLKSFNLREWCVYPT